MKKVFFLQAALLVFIAVLYLYADVYLQFGLTIWWWDILLHFLGGLWVGLAGAWVFSRIGIRLGLLQCIAIALAVGLAWELFEYIFGLIGSRFMSYEMDTIKDLCDDMLGGALAYVLLKRVRS